MDEYIVQTSTLTQKYYMLLKLTLQFVLPLSFFSFMISYYNLTFSTLIYPKFDQAFDRKYMFLICNGILVLLVKNLKFRQNYDVVKISEVDEQQIIELPQLLVEATVQENVAYIEHGDHKTTNVVVEEEKQIERQQEQDFAGEEVKTGSFVIENEDWKEEENDNGDDENEEELEVSTVIESSSSTSIEEINDARVSTEELNKKFEEFIRKMKEEIRIEAQQQLVTV